MSGPITPHEVRYFQKRTIGNLATGQLVETWRKGDEMLLRYTFRLTEENNPYTKPTAEEA